MGEYADDAIQRDLFSIDCQIDQDEDFGTTHLKSKNFPHMVVEDAELRERFSKVQDEEDFFESEYGLPPGKSTCD